MLKRIGPSTFAFLLATLLLVGCSPKDPPKDPTPPGGSTTGGTGDTGGTGSTGDGDQGGDPAEIPDTAKTDAFKFLGLDVTKEQDYVYASIKGQEPQAGSQQIIYLGMKDGAPNFRISRKGSLSVLGNEEVASKADGVYSLTSNLGTLKNPVMTLPAKLTVGGKWDSSYEIDAPDGQVIKFVSKSEVVRQEKVKVRAGEFDAMLVTMTATVTQGENKANVTGKSWYAAGVGTVKLTLEGKNSKGDPIYALVELAKK